MDHDDAIARLTALSADQFGVFTVEQAAAAGVDVAILERLEQGRRLRWTVDGVYELRDAQFDEAETYGLWLALDPATLARDRIAPQCGVLSHRGAAVWLGSVGFSSELVVTIPPGAPVPSLTGRNAKRVYVHQASLPAGDWFIHNGVPVTTPARMVRDLLEVDDEPLPLEDTTSVGRMLLGIQQRSGLDLEVLAAELDEYARRENYISGEYLVSLLCQAAQPGSK